MQAIEEKDITILTIRDEFIDKVKDIFDNGVGLRKTELKKYTGDNLQVLSTFAINKIATLRFGPNNYRLDGNYIKDPTGVYQSERLDDHLWYNNKIIMAGESRAWIDKPFATLKYGVVNSFVSMDHTINVSHPDIFFPFLTFAFDIKKETFATLNYIYSKFSDKIKIYNLSGNKRDSKKDYFYRGYSESECERYIFDMYNSLLKITK